MKAETQIINTDQESARPSRVQGKPDLPPTSQPTNQLTNRPTDQLDQLDTQSQPTSGTGHNSEADHIVADIIFVYVIISRGQVVAIRLFVRKVR